MPRLRRNFAALTAAVVFLLTIVPASANQYSSWSLSGLCTNALIAAYRAAGLDGELAAPFRLQPYTVNIRQRGTGFEVNFFAETSREYHVVFVDGGTGKILGTRETEVPDVPDGKAVLLPGIVAGEIIAAYRHALGDEKVPEYHTERLKSGAYNLAFDPSAGSTTVAFIPLSDVRPPAVSTSPAPEPTPSGGMKCLAGNCDNRLVYYVTVLDAKVVIRSQAII